MTAYTLTHWNPFDWRRIKWTEHKDCEQASKRTNERTSERAKAKVNNSHGDDYDDDDEFIRYRFSLGVYIPYSLCLGNFGAVDFVCRYLYACMCVCVCWAVFSLHFLSLFLLLLCAQPFYAFGDHLILLCGCNCCPLNIPSAETSHIIHSVCMQTAKLVERKKKQKIQKKISKNHRQLVHEKSITKMRILMEASNWRSPIENWLLFT